MKQPVKKSAITGVSLALIHATRQITRPAPVEAVGEADEWVPEVPLGDGGADAFIAVGVIHLFITAPGLFIKKVRITPC